MSNFVAQSANTVSARKRTRVWPALLTLGICTTLLVLQLDTSFSHAHAQLRPTLQPLSTATPVPQPAQLPQQRGAHIALTLNAIRADATQVVVQWEWPTGVWHDVEGWRTALDTRTPRDGVITWWVGPEHYGTGPFRWALYAGDGRARQLIQSSAGFRMPVYDGGFIKSDLP